MRILYVVICALLALSCATLAATPARDPAPTASRQEAETATVTVVLPQRSAREHQIPWKRGMTVDSAIAQAAGARSFPWKEAWRWRANFWTRNFSDPHSFIPRIFAGEKALGFQYFPRAEGATRKAQLRPGDRIFVDLEPIA